MRETSRPPHGVKPAKTPPAPRLALARPSALLPASLVAAFAQQGGTSELKTHSLPPTVVDALAAISADDPISKAHLDGKRTATSGAHPGKRSRSLLHGTTLNSGKDAGKSQKNLQTLKSNKSEKSIATADSAAAGSDSESDDEDGFPLKKKARRSASSTQKVKKGKISDDEATEESPPLTALTVAGEAGVNAGLAGLKDFSLN